MAAPKLWGYTRKQPIGNEMLVSWTDGDLTAILAKEVEERLLGEAQERANLAAFARACQDSWRPGSREDGNRLLEPRPALVDLCASTSGTPPEDVEDRRVAALRPRASWLLGGGAILLVSLLLALWMVRNL
jgi:hypothetical protein